MNFNIQYPISDIRYSRRSRRRAGFTLIEMLVASLLLSMMVVILSMIFSSSAIAWRTGTAGVSGLHKARKNLAAYQLAADSCIPHLEGEKRGLGYIRAVWMNGTTLVDAEGKTGVTRGFSDTSTGSAGVDSSKPFKQNLPINGITENSFQTYIVGVGSAGPDRTWDTKDDIATWPRNAGGNL